MSTTTKWILGIVIGLIVLAVFFVIGYLVMDRWGGVNWLIAPRLIQPVEGWRFMPMHPDRGFPYQRYPGFFSLRMIGSWLLCLAIPVLFGLGIAALVLGLRRPSQSTKASSPAVQPPQAKISESNRTCPSCGQAVQEDWNHCPYCGTDLVSA